MKKKKHTHGILSLFFLFFLLHGLTTVFRNIGCIIGENFICCADSFFFFFFFVLCTCYTTTRTTT